MFYTTSRNDFSRFSSFKIEVGRQKKNSEDVESEENETKCVLKTEIFLEIA